MKQDGDEWLGKVVGGKTWQAPPPDGCLRKTLSAHMASPTHSLHTPDTQFRAQNIFPPPCWRGTPGLLAHLPAAGWRWGPTASEVLGGLNVSERNDLECTNIVCHWDYRV